MGSGGMALQQTSIADTIKYLGVKFNPWGGVEKSDMGVALDQWYLKIGKSLLKPSQRVVLLNQYIIPRIFYQADLCEVSDSVLQSLNRTIRKFVKKWLHLPQSTCDGLIYAAGRRPGNLQALSTNPINPGEEALQPLSRCRRVGLDHDG